MRAFLAVEIDEPTRSLVGEIVDRFSKHDLPVKWVQPENMHITVKFLGEVGESGLTQVKAAVGYICGKIAAFNMRLIGLGCFPRPSNPRVIWIGVDQGASELITLASAIEVSMKALGYKPEERYHAHLTIGRVRKPCAVDKILKTEFRSGIIGVKNLQLFESTLTPSGPIYKAIEKFDLTAA